MNSGNARTTQTVHVDETNDRGIKVGGDWLNFSRFSKAIAPCSAGMTVEIEQDGRGFITRLSPVSGGYQEFGAAPSGDHDHYGRTPTAKDVLIVKQTALKCATEFAASRAEMKSADVLKVATAFARWVLSTDDEPST